MLPCPAQSESIPWIVNAWIQAYILIISMHSARNFMWTGPDPPHHFSTAVSFKAAFRTFIQLKARHRSCLPRCFPYSQHFPPTAVLHIYISPTLLSPIQSSAQMLIGQAFLASPPYALFILVKRRSSPQNISLTLYYDVPVNSKIPRATSNLLRLFSNTYVW